MKAGVSHIWTKLTEILNPSTKTTTYTSSAIDLSAADEIVTFVVHSANSTGAAGDTLTPKIQDCDTSGGTFADLATPVVWVQGSDLKTVVTAIPGLGGSNPGPILGNLNTRNCRQFVKLVLTPAGAGAQSFVVGAGYLNRDTYPSN